MNEENKSNKIERVLGIYTKLLNGKMINKAEEANNYQVNIRSIQRDITDIRDFLESDREINSTCNDVVYDHPTKSYKLSYSENLQFTNSEILALCKIILDSRAFQKEHVVKLLQTMINSCVPKKNQNTVADMIRNEEHHYVELRHKKNVLPILWQVAQAIKENHIIRIDYLRMKDQQVVQRKLKPLGITFSEFYFYLIAFIDEPQDKDFQPKPGIFSPVIYRLDRIQNFVELTEKFHIPYTSRFEEGIFRKQIQFMFGGKLEEFKFKYTGNDIDSIMDRLPTAEIISQDQEGYVISAKLYGKGMEMWLRSQGDMVEPLNKNKI